jgi:hypothetical protein
MFISLCGAKLQQLSEKRANYLEKCWLFTEKGLTLRPK